MRKLFLVTPLLLCLPTPYLLAQKKFIEQSRVSVSFGLRNIQRDSLPNNQNIDFVNYLYSEEEYSEYEYLTIAAHLWFNDHWQGDLKLSMYDDFVPNNLNITAQFYPIPQIGVNFGFYSHSQLLNEFSTYHKINDTDFYGDLDPNFRQRTLIDAGFMGGLVADQSFNRLHINLKFNAGFSSFSTFKETVYQKEINGNFKRRIDYETSPGLNSFIFPEMEINFDCFKSQSNRIGIKAYASWYSSKKSINYRRKSFEWTTDSPEVNDIDGPQHDFSKWEVDLGIYWQW